MNDEVKIDEIRQSFREHNSNKNFWAIVEVKLKNSFKCISQSGITFRLRTTDDALFSKIDEGDILHLCLKGEEFKVLSIDKQKQKKKK